MRWTFVDVEPRVEALTCDGVGQLTFAETGAGGGPTAGATKFPAPIAALLSKSTFSMKWLNVPWDYISEDPDILWPTKIMACVGRVNSDALFNGFFPAGTVLMQPPQFSIKPSPVASDDVDYPNMLVDVTLNYEYFNPDKGAVSAYRGHNLMPWRGAPTDPHGGKFFYATRGGGVGDPPLLTPVAMAEVFEHVFG